jgi:hypothetical protein
MIARWCRQETGGFARIKFFLPVPAENRSFVRVWGQILNMDIRLGLSGKLLDYFLPLFLSSIAAMLERYHDTDESLSFTVDEYKRVNPWKHENDPLCWTCFSFDK